MINKFTIKEGLRSTILYKIMIIEPGIPIMKNNDAIKIVDLFQKHLIQGWALCV
jgi:hypothetical protein